MIRKLFFFSIFVLAFILSIVFAAFNTHSVTLSVYFSEWQLPLSLIVIISLVIGLLIGALLLFFGAMKLRYQNHRLQQKLTAVEQELNSLRILPIKDEH